MSEFDFKLINAENVTLSDDTILLGNAFSCVLNLQVLREGNITNSFETIYDNDNEWITVKKNFVDGDTIKSNFSIYIEDNYTNYERYYYLSLRSNLSGEISTIIIKQPSCNFNIEIDKNEIVFNKTDEIQFVNVKVYGANKTCIINKDYIDICTDSEIFDYDNSLYFYLEKLPEEKYTKYKEYRLAIKFLGKFSDIENYYYKFPIVHSDNVDTKQILKINLKLQDKESEEMENIVNNEYNIQNVNEQSTIKARNETNLESKIQPQETQIDNSVRIMSKARTIEKKESISNVIINGNQIALQTNTYNRNGDIEHNSMLVIQPKALWCHTTSDYKDSLHYINIECDNNFWGVDRKTLVNVRNAENGNPYDKKVFVIKQNTNNEISIEEKVNN